MKKIIFVALALGLLLLALGGCGTRYPSLEYVADGQVFHTDVLEEEDEIFDKPEKTPTKEGFCFGGWFFDEGVWEKPLDYTVLNAEKTNSAYRVYAKWEVVALEYDKDSRAYTVTGLLAGAGSEIVIPATYEGVPVAKIADKAFKGQNGIISVTIPDTVKSIGEYAFEECSGLKSIVLPNTVTEVRRGAFKNCTALESVTLSTLLVEIEAEVFCGCSSLKAVEIPAGVARLGYRAFSRCTALTELTLPFRISSMGMEVFSRTNLTAITYKGEKENWDKIQKNDFSKDSALLLIHCIDGDVAP